MLGVAVMAISVLFGNAIIAKAANTGVIYSTPSDWTTSTYGTRNSAVSPRAIQLKYQSNSSDNGKLLVTWEYGVIENATNGKVFPIYESTDNGVTYQSVGNVIETQNQMPTNANNRWGMECCPQLYELPADVGDMKKGGVVCIGDVCPKDLSKTHFDMYYSDDMGKTWTFKSSLVTDGGKNIMGDDPVWEPFILYDNVSKKLICYYSDERSPQYAQKLVYQATSDGKNWGDPVDVVAWTDSGMRPGMPVITQLENGYYVMTYESVGLNNNSPIPCNYKISLNPNDPLHWDAKDVGTTFGYGGSPFCTTLSDGRVAMLAANESGIYINTKKDLSGKWEIYPTGVSTGYNRQILPLNDGTLYMLSCGFPDSGGKNKITWGKIDLSSLQPTSGIPSDAVQVSNKTTRRYICIWSTSLNDGARVVGWENNGGKDFNWTMDKVDDTHVKIVNVNSGKVLTATTNSQVAQDEYQTDNNKQLWTVTDKDSEGYVQIINAGTNQVLSSTERKTDSGNPDDVAMFMADNTSVDTQKWKLESSIKGENTYSITDNIDSNLNIQVYPSTGSVKEGTEQYFILGKQLGTQVTRVYVNGQAVTLNNGSWFKVSNVSSNITITADATQINPDCVSLCNKDSGRYLCLPGNSTAEGKEILEWSLENSSNFFWILKETGKSHEYMIENQNSKMLISVKDNSAENNASVIQTANTDVAGTKWSVHEVTPGYYSIINVNSGLALTRGYYIGNDSYAKQQIYTGADTQLWKLDYILNREKHTITTAKTNGGNIVAD